MFVLSDTEIKARVIGTMSDSVPILLLLYMYVCGLVHQSKKNMRV